jgi:hypothetical protein
LSASKSNPARKVEMALHPKALRPATNQTLDDHAFRDDRFRTGLDACYR